MDLHERTRHGIFFRAIAIFFVLVTFVGFAPTFFLRPFTDAPSLPLRFHIHGFFATAWVLLFFAQTVLIARRSFTLHRRMGVLGGCIAAGLVLSGLVILYYVAIAYPQNGRELNQVSALVWGNIAGLTVFSVFVGLGIAFRRRPQTHKRLMLLGTLSIMGQPLVRIGHLDLFRVSDSMIVNDAVYGLGGILALFTVVAIHDVIVLRRVHHTVAWGLPFQLGMTILAGLVLSTSEFGHALILLF